MGVKKFSEQTEIVIVGRYKNGETKKNLAQEFNVLEKTIRKILIAHGVNEQAIRYSEYTKKKVLEMALDGKSAMEIVEETGVSVKMAQDYKRRISVQNKQIIKSEKLYKARPKEHLHRIVVGGTSYIDITDFVAGI